MFVIFNGSNMTFKALIAVRPDSQRVVNKNIRPFAHSSLLEIKIQQLLKIKELDGVVVNSSDRNMLAIAKKYGCEIIERNQYYASNSVCMSEVYENMANNIDCDVVIYSNCTNPLIRTETIRRCIELYIENGSYDSVNTANSVKKFLFLNNSPVNYKLTEQPRSQDLPPITSLNFAVNVISKKHMIKYKNIVGHNPYLYLVDDMEGLDIDTPLDFEIAEYLFKKYGND